MKNQSPLERHGDVPVHVYGRDGGKEMTNTKPYNPQQIS